MMRRPPDSSAWEQIAEDYNLNLADVYAALTYYYDHKEEIDRSMLEDEKFVEEMKRQYPSKLKKKLDGN